MSIKLHLIVFSLISLLFALTIGTSGFWSERKMSASLQENGIAVAAMRHHMEADMMHDALRADVLAAALAGSLKQADRRKAIEQELAEHVKLFRDALQENEDLPLTPNIVQSILKIRPSLDAYLEDSQAVVALAFDKPGEIEARLPKFMEAFDVLETEMAALSDLIEKNAAETTSSAQADAAHSEKLIIGVLVATILCISLLVALLIRNILSKVRRDLDAVDRLNDGGLTHRLPRTVTEP